MRWRTVSKKDLASVLLIEFISDFSENLDSVAAGNDRQLHPPETSITTSETLGGTGSPCF